MAHDSFMKDDASFWHAYTERLFIWEINKDELVFNIFLYENREKRGFVIFIDIIEPIFNIGITIFNNLRAKN